ncbi:hypothetical protein [Shouchella clausii]|uniref:Uncharacterized protein n=1 Tax=Shouchella clausii TaxID=79880 RepID=A0A268S444_SHOCL|nr:hypothetical protein [Shouchella clausii]PAE87816.1 hypothetical protein CHH72_16425 [Shouchella clausii]PAF27270.1 hypothetical protein CHH61_04250 [Shouchella clausii]
MSKKAKAIELADDPAFKPFYMATILQSCDIHPEYGVIYPAFCPHGGWYHATVGPSFDTQSDAQEFADRLNRERDERLS